MLLAVPCADDDTVALLDADDGSDAGRIAVGSHPVHLASAGDRVLVATMGERSVDVVAGGAVERVPTGVLGPSHVAVRDGRAFVPCTGGDAVAVINLDGPDRCGRVAVGAEPHDAEVAGDAVYVGSRGDGTVTVLDAETAAVRATVDLPGDRDTPRVQGLATAADGVYAVDQANERVVYLDAGGVRAAAPVGADPYEPVVTDGRVLVAGRAEGTVTELPADLSARTTHDVGGRPVALAPLDGSVWVFDGDHAVARSLSGGEVTLPHPVLSAAGDPRRPERAYVAHYDDDAVSALDTGDRAVRWTTTTPARPFEPLVV